MSVREGVFYARFQEGTPFSLGAIKDAVRRASLTYRQTELVARGRLMEPPAEEVPGLLLVDDQAGMVLLLTQGDKPAVMEELRAAFRTGSLADTDLQVFGTVVETGEAEADAQAAGADLVVTLERFAPAAEAPLPPVYPREQQKGSDTWF